MKTSKVTPSHYRNEGGELWEQMVEVFGVDAFADFCRLNAYKYRMRAGRKEGEDIETDIRKALWYENKLNNIYNGE